MMNSGYKLAMFGMICWSLIACQLHAGQAADTSSTNQSDVKPAMQATMQNIRVEVIFKNNQCGSEHPPQLIKDDINFRRVYGAANSAFIGGTNRQTPQVDFTTHSVLYLPMGQQTTGGYVIKLSDPQLRIENGVATLKIDWQEPAPGMMMIQVLTSPCLFIKIPKADFSRIVVMDQNNQTRADVSVEN